MTTTKKGPPPPKRPELLALETLLAQEHELFRQLTQVRHEISGAVRAARTATPEVPMSVLSTMSKVNRTTIWELEERRTSWVNGKARQYAEMVLNAMKKLRTKPQYSFVPEALDVA